MEEVKTGEEKDPAEMTDEERQNYYLQRNARAAFPKKDWSNSKKTFQKGVPLPQSKYTQDMVKTYRAEVTDIKQKVDSLTQLMWAALTEKRGLIAEAFPNRADQSRETPNTLEALRGIRNYVSEGGYVGPYGKDSEKAQDTDLGKNPTWKLLRAMTLRQLEKMTSEKVFSTFVHDPELMKELSDMYGPAAVARFQQTGEGTTSFKRTILEAFILDFWGESFLKKAWNKGKQLATTAVNHLWDKFVNSATFKDAKESFEEFVEDIQKGNYQDALTKAASLTNAVTDLVGDITSAATNPVRTLKTVAREMVGDNPDLSSQNIMDIYTPRTTPANSSSYNPAAATTNTTPISSASPMMLQSAGKPTLTGAVNISRDRTRYHYDSVSLPAIAGWICPEEFPSRMPVDMTQRTAIAGSVWTETFQTNSNGALGVYIFPWAILQNNVFTAYAAPISPVYPFGLVYNSSTFIPGTGYSGATPTGITGPLNTMRSSVQAYRVNACSIRVVCLPSLNNSQGQVQIAYFTDYPNSTFAQAPAAGPSIPQSSMPSMTNYQLINLKTTDVRATTVIDGPSDLTMIENSGDILAYNNIDMPDIANEGWYILLTGGPASSSVLSITVSYSVEFLATVTSLPMLNVLYSEPGPATLSLISNLIKANPRVLRLQLEECRALAGTIIASESHKHDDVMNLILDWLEKLPTVTINQSPFVSNAFFPGQLSLPESGGPEPIYE